MIIRQKQLEGIKKGTISLAFRRWTRPSVRKGTLLKTAIGQVEILNIEVIDVVSIREDDAHKAGFETRDELLASLADNNAGNVYRIGVRYHSPDPRINLRNQIPSDKTDFEIIRKKLQRLDKANAGGPWTSGVLHAIQSNPRTVSTELAKQLGYERMWLKTQICKLKNLGLTISHDVGYEISPLGKAVLKYLELS